MENTYYSKLDTQGYYIIAEIGVNYYEIAEKYNISALDAAKLMMKNAKDAGADAAKFQTYKAETLTMVDSPGSWDRNDITVDTQYELFKLYDKFGEQEYSELSKYAKEIDIDFMSTPFDMSSADYLDKYMEVYKISSSDISNIPLIKRIAQKNKPIIMSIGASDLDEIVNAVDLIKSINDKKLTLLHCVLEYPTPYTHANLKKISGLKKKYPDMIIGYSDHTKPDSHMDVIKTAFLLGAQVIEKHFTLDKTIVKKNDHFHSMDCEDLVKIKSGLEFIKKLQGSSELKCLDSEITTRNSVRRSAISFCDIKKGTVLKENMVIFKRPGNGMSPEQTQCILGKKANCDIKKDQLLLEEQFE